MNRWAGLAVDWLSILATTFTHLTTVTSPRAGKMSIYANVSYIFCLRPDLYKSQKSLFYDSWLHHKGTRPLKACEWNKKAKTNVLWNISCLIHSSRILLTSHPCCCHYCLTEYLSSLNRKRRRYDNSKLIWLKCNLCAHFHHTTLKSISALWMKISFSFLIY